MTWNQRLAAAALAVALVAVPAAAQPELVTDRPDQTESTAVVPPGFLQLETGFLHTRASEGNVDVETLEAPGTLLRIGAVPGFELRIEWDGYVREKVTAGSSQVVLDGLGDAAIGAKLSLWPARGSTPEAALMASIGLPVGDSAVSSGEPDPSIRLALANDINDRLSWGVNLGAEWETVREDGPPKTVSTFIYTAALGIGVSDRAGAFVELFGGIPGSAPGGPQHSIDGGWTWLVRPNLQLDAYAGGGLSEEAPDWFIGAGFSLRLPD